MFRAFSHLKIEPSVDLEGVMFLQAFVNGQVKLAVDRQLLHTLGQAIMIPENLFEFGAMYKPEAWNMVKASFTASGCINLSAMFQGRGQDILAAWSVVARGDGQSQVKVSSASMDLAMMGDVIAFVLAQLGLEHGGALLGFALSLCHYFGLWLSENMDRLLDFQSVIELPELKGIFRRRNLDPKALAIDLAGFAEGENSGPGSWKDREAAKVLAYSYNAELNRTLNMAPTLTKTVVADGWRSQGEAMDLYFAFSPVLNIGGWLPFQVPLAILCFHFCH